MKAQHPEGGNDEKVAQKGVGGGGNMTSDKKKSASVNLTLSLKHIQRFFDALPSDVTGDLAKKKENAEAALEHLNDFFDSKVGDVLTARPCSPRPYLPDLP